MTCISLHDLEIKCGQFSDRYWILSDMNLLWYLRAVLQCLQLSYLYMSHLQQNW